ncbi:MAG: hypothetical protein OXH86_09120 [Acidimicrobiaceae bacterium]|nr:hypothetical protein [Acidimicrobiaceae bacterium]
MATLQQMRRHAGPRGALSAAARRVERTHDRIITVRVPPRSRKDNWVAAGDAVREAWIMAGAELRGAMGQFAAEQEETTA